MAFNDLFSIHHRPGLTSLSSIARYRSHRPSAAGQTAFKNILSAIQTRPPKKTYKIRGLTIADYRARPVLTKSRLRPRPLMATGALNPKAVHRFPGPASPATINAGAVKNQLQDRPKTRSVVTAPKPERNIQHQPPVLTERQIIEKSVQKAAVKYDLPPVLIKAVMRAESNFEVGAVSRAGAKGLMQLMPATARELGVTDIFDIEQNIDGGAKYLRWMLDRFDGNVRKALAAYNAGPGTVIKYNGRVPYPETRQYVKRVLRFSRQMA